jgi:tetratricopeptide (TPR) repeat protein
VKVTPLIPDGHNGPIKQLSCSICRHIFYVTLADYEELSPNSYCHECSVILLTELHAIQRTEAREGALTPPAKVQPAPPPRVPQPRSIDREKMTPAQLVEEGNAYIKAWQYNKALASFDQALEKSPTSAASHRCRGAALSKLARYEEASAPYEEALRLDPTYAAAYAGKGEVLRHFKRSDEALASYEQALQLNPSLDCAYLDKYRALQSASAPQSR